MSIETMAIISVGDLVPKNVGIPIYKDEPHDIFLLLTDSPV